MMISFILTGILAGSTALVAAQTTTLQAESATLSGVAVGTSVPGYTGNGSSEF
jgi:mannan endo-1,4-beta-mannosidase